MGVDSWAPGRHRGRPRGGAGEEPNILRQVPGHGAARPDHTAPSLGPDHADPGRVLRRRPVGGGAVGRGAHTATGALMPLDRKSTRLNSSHVSISYAVFCLKKTSH